MLGSRRHRRCVASRLRCSLASRSYSLQSPAYSLPPCPIAASSVSSPTTNRCSRCFSPPRSSCGPIATAISICRSTCRDRSGSINARMWNASEDDYRAFENGDFVHVDGADAAVPGQHADDRHPHPPGPARRGVRGRLHHAADGRRRADARRGWSRSWPTSSRRRCSGWRRRSSTTKRSWPSSAARRRR